MTGYKESASPSVDSSLGLVYRLNNLWAQAGYYSRQAAQKWGAWDLTLDEIHRNLTYDPNGNEKSIKAEKDYEEYSLIVKMARKDFYKTNNAGGRRLYYAALQAKDIWLRKLMQSKKLYMKESQGFGDELYG